MAHLKKSSLPLKILHMVMRLMIFFGFVVRIKITSWMYNILYCLAPLYIVGTSDYSLLCLHSLFKAPPYLCVRPVDLNITSFTSCVWFIWVIVTWFHLYFYPFSRPSPLYYNFPVFSVGLTFYLSRYLSFLSIYYLLPILKRQSLGIMLWSDNRLVITEAKSHGPGHSRLMLRVECSVTRWLNNFSIFGHFQQ